MAEVGADAEIQPGVGDLFCNCGVLYSSCVSNPGAPAGTAAQLTEVIQQL